MIAETFEVKVEAQTSQFKKDLSDLQRQVEKFSQEINNIGSVNAGNINQLKSAYASIADTIYKSLQDKLKELRVGLVNDLNSGNTGDAQARAEYINQLDALAKEVKNTSNNLSTLGQSGDDVKGFGGEISVATDSFRELNAEVSKLYKLMGWKSPNAPEQSEGFTAPTTTTSTEKNQNKQGFDWKLITKGIFGVASIYALIRKIVSENEAFMSAINEVISLIAQIFKPVLDFIANILVSIVDTIRTFFGIEETTSENTTAINRTIASFDEIQTVKNNDNAKSAESTDTTGKKDPNRVPDTTLKQSYDYLYGTTDEDQKAFDKKVENWKEIIANTKAINQDIIDQQSKNVDSSIDKWRNTFKWIDDMWKNVGNTFNSKIKPIFTTAYWNDKMNNVRTAITNGVNTMKTTVKTGILSGINDVINKINNSGFVTAWNSLFKTNLKINTIACANGGIAVRPTTALIGEAGKEAVLPLERNTEWMDALANKINGSNPTTLQLVCDNKVLGQVAISSINSITKSTGKLQLVI